MAFKDTLNKTKKNAEKKAKEKKYAEKPSANKPAKISEVVKATPTKSVNGKAQTATKSLPKSYKETKGSTVVKLEAQKKAGRQWERSKAAGMDSSSLAPLNLLKRDAISGTTTRDKNLYARTSGAVGRLSAAEVKAKNKKAGEERAARDQKSAAQVLSRQDKRLSKREQTLIRDAKTSYYEAREKGDKAGMQAAHRSAENIRKSHGYSGGATGQESISPELTHEEKVLLNKTGQERLKMAKMNLEAAKAAGNENGIAAAERAVKRTLETDAFRNEGTKKLSGFVTGHGQTVDRKPLSMEEFREGEKKFNEGLYSVMAAVPGSILSLVETSNQAIENDFREKNWDYINDKANRLQEYKTKLELAKRGEGNPKWGSIAQLEQQVKIAERAEKMRSAGTTVDPNLPGQTLMRKSTEAQQKFMEGRTGVDRLLASAGLSMGHMIPALAASAIPGVGPAIGAGIMGAQAAGSKAYELNERGVDPAESQMRGIVSGGIEAVTEKIPISSLLKMVKAGGGANLLKSMAKQAGIEATEESISYALNHAADVAAKDPEAKFSMNDLLESAAVGAISGGTFGGIGSVVGRKVYGGQVQETAQPSRLESLGQQALMKASGFKERLSPPAEAAQNTPEQVPTQAVEAQSSREERAEPVAETPRERFNRRYQDVMARIQAVTEDPAQKTPEVYADLSSELQAVMEEGNRLTQQERKDAGQVSRNFGEAESHIDNRTPEEMGSRSVKAFQFDHPQLHQYYVQAAEALKRDAEYSFETQRSGRGNGTAVRRSEQLERAKSMGLTRNEIIRVCDDIIADNGQENYAAAKRVELILDDMLSRGYIPNEGTTEADTKIPANEAYIQAKNQIPGAATGFDRYKRDNSLALELGEVTEEELRSKYEAGLPEGQGAMSKGGAGAFASWQAERSNFHPISQEGYARTAEKHGRAPVEIPARDPTGMLTSKTVSTLANASISNNQLVQSLEEDAAAGGYSYTAYGDRAALAQAEARIREIGFQRAKEEWIAEARAGKLSKDNTAMGLTLINNAANSGTLEGHIDAHDLIGHYISYARAAGQALQAMNMVNRMTPTGQLYTLVKTAENLEINIKNRAGKDVDITIDPELSRRFTEAETQEERDAIRQEIYRDIAAQVPNTWRDKFDAWRYLSMLGNPRTHIRNIAGNLFFDPVRVTKNVIGTGLESVFSRNDRTKTITSRALSAEDRARYLAAKADFQEVKDVVMSGGKYNDEWSQIDEYRTIFKTKPLEAVRKANTAALEAEDRFFSSRAYADSLAGFLKANKITAEEYLSPDFDQAMKEKAREYAIREAQKATYRDLNAASELVSGLSRFKRSDKAFNRAVGYLVEGVLPFKKTPTNIAVRAVEYSPAGLVKGLADAGTKVRRGEMSAADAIDEIASGLTGTGLLALGAALSHAGFVLGGSSGDDKQDDFDKLQGHQEYALEIGGESVTLDWLAPEALPFFVGVELEKFVSGLKSGETEKADWSKAATRILEPMLEMSMLQSLNDVINSVGSEVPFVSSVASAAMSYLGQFVPTLGGQIERSFLEDTRQQTVIDKESAIPSSVQYMLGTIGNKIPIPGVDFYQQDYVDAWGRKKSTGTILNRVLNNFLNPAYVSKLNTTDVDAELQRLYDGGYDGVFPGEFGKSMEITVDEAGKKTRTLTAEERQKAQETRGKTAYDLLSKTMADGSYQSMTDAEKAKFVDSVYEYAKAVARIEAGEDPEHYDSWIGKSSDYAEKTGGGISDFFLARNKKNQIDADDNKQDGEKAWEFETWVDGQDRLSAEQKSYLKENLKIWGFHPADSSKYVKGTSAGLSVEQIRTASDAYSRADAEFGDGNGSVKQGELWQSIKALGLSDEESAKLYEQAKPKNWKATWYTSKRQ